MLRERFQRLRDWLKRKFRVEVIEEETLSQSQVFSIRPRQIILWSVLLFLLIVGSTLTVFVFTPAFHQIIPGYIYPEEFRREQAIMYRELDAREKEIARWALILEGLRKVAGVPADSLGMMSTRAIDYDSLRRSYDQRAGRANPESNPNSAVIRTVDRQNDGYNLPLINLFPPLQGAVTNPFDPKTQHFGTDIASDENTLIRSVADGFVVFAEYSEDTGHVIGVASPGNLVTFYKHNSRLLKGVGSRVFAGEAVAVIGNSGENSSGPHLHLELWHNGLPVNPQYYLTFN